MNEIAEFTRIEIESAQEVAMEYGSGKNKRSGSRVIVKTTDGDTMSLVPWEEGFAASRKALMAGGACDVVIERKGDYLNIKAAKAAGEATPPKGVQVVSGEAAPPAKPSVSQSIPDRTRQILIIRQSCLKAAIELMALPNFPLLPPELADTIEEIEEKTVEVARYFEKQYILAGVKES